jgi:FlaA1/EpsC-like NDP-sugar epimerase
VLPALLRGVSITALLTVSAIVPILVWQASGLRVVTPLVGPVALLVLLQILGLRVFRVHRRAWRYVTLSDVVAIAAGLTLGTAATFLLGLGATLFDVQALEPAAALPAGLLASMLILSFNVQVLARVLRRWSTRRRSATRSKLDDAAHHALIIGAGSVAAGVIREASARLEGRHRIVGLLSDLVPRGELIAGVRVLGGVDGLEDIARDVGATLVIVATDRDEPEQLRSIVARAQRIGLPVHIRANRPLTGFDRQAPVVRPVDLGDLMPRSVASMDTGDIARLVSGRSIIVTGAAGSIGSELARQLLRLRPSRLVLIDRSESGLWALERELAPDAPLGVIEPVLLDVRDPQLLTAVFRAHAPALILHAAALKHVPMLERNVPVAVLNNVLGTASVAEACVRSGVTRLVLISTDKAVAPTSVMGATERLAERIVSDAAARSGRDFVSVRFGNVLSSSGSVLEVFRAQIEAGGPVTITDPEMTRSFMTTDEAAGLVLHAATLRASGEVLILDTGEPRRIVDLAEDLIRLHGFEPGRDIEVVVTGRRAGEKLHEQLAAPTETLEPTEHPSILSVRGQVQRWPERDAVLIELRDLARANDVERLRARLLEIANEGVVPGDGGTIDWRSDSIATA